MYFILCIVGRGLPVLNEEGNLVTGDSEQKIWVSDATSTSEVYRHCFTEIRPVVSLIMLLHCARTPGVFQLSSLKMIEIIDYSTHLGKV